MTIKEIANSKNFNPSYVSHVRRMPLLAPDIMEAILAGKQPERLTLARAMNLFSYDWSSQSRGFTETEEALSGLYSIPKWLA